MMEEKLMKLKDVLPIVNVASSTWRRWVKEGSAPKPIKRGRCTFWRSSEITEYVTNEQWTPQQAGQGSLPKPATSGGVL